MLEEVRAKRLSMDDLFRELNRMIENDRCGREFRRLQSDGRADSRAFVRMLRNNLPPGRSGNRDLKSSQEKAQALGIFTPARPTRSVLPNTAALTYDGVIAKEDALEMDAMLERYGVAERRSSLSKPPVFAPRDQESTDPKPKSLLGRSSAKISRSPTDLKPSAIGFTPNRPTRADDQGRTQGKTPAKVVADTDAFLKNYFVKEPQRAKGNTNNADLELEKTLSGDPTVLGFGDNVSLRFASGGFLGLETETTMEGDKENTFLGAPTLRKCEFAFVDRKGNKKDAKKLKFGDSVCVVCVSNGLHLGAYPEKVVSLSAPSAVKDLEVTNSDKAKYRVEFLRKVAGRAEQWVLTEMGGGCPERQKEAWARRKTRSPNASVRSSDEVALQSAWADHLFLSAKKGKGGLLTLELVADPVGWFATKTPAPFQPNWARSRGFLDQGLVQAPDSKTDRAVDAVLDEVFSQKDKVKAQEDLLVGDLIFALSGTSGELVEYSTDSGNGNGNPTLNQFQVNASAEKRMDPSLVFLVKRFLPLCAYYVQLQQFVRKKSRHECGKVAHALAAGMQSLLREYDILMAQLEDAHFEKDLSLQKLWFFVQPSIKTLEFLHTISLKCARVNGGALLNALHSGFPRQSDAKLGAIYRFLMQKAARPYLKMLEGWIYHGVIRDPFDEFMVKEDRSQESSKKTLMHDYNTKYWNTRYTIRCVKTGSGLEKTKTKTKTKTTDKYMLVPFFLQRAQGKILITGKYLNVVRDCDKWVKSPFAGKIEWTDADHEYDEIILKAYQWASRTLLNVLLTENKLMQRLQSLKNYFLLDQGDFFVHFMDVAGPEMLQPPADIPIGRLQSLLEMCLRSRNTNDPWVDHLSCELLNHSVLQHVERIHTLGSVESPTGTLTPELAFLESTTDSAVVPTKGLTGVEAFSLNVQVQWPLSLVLSKQALTKYQLVFRHLFYCKHVERQLLNTWTAHQNGKDLANLRKTLGPEYCLRQHMLHFLQNFQYYVMFEVLEPRWHEFQMKLQNLSTVDDLMRFHNEFLDTCLRECLLTHQNLLKTLAKLMATCLMFADQIKRFAAQLELKKPDDALRLRGQTRAQRDNTRAKVRSQHVAEIVSQPQYRHMIQRSHDTFDGMLRDFMQKLLDTAVHGEYHSHLTNLVQRLDYNRYYDAN